MGHSILGRALVANGLFSALTGGVLVALAGRVAPRLGIEQVAILRAVGVGLVAFSALVLWQSARRRRRMPLVLAITLADLTWVVATIVLLGVAGQAFSGAGVAAMVVAALFVAGFAAAQLRGIARAYATPEGTPFSHHVCLEIASGAESDRLWPAIRDLGRIADYAPGLATSRLRDGRADVGAIRECRARSGAQWAERCVILDDEHRRVELEFLTREPGFPFPFSRMRGGWEVQEEHKGCRVRVWWDVTPTRAWLAAAILPIMELQAARDMARTVEAMGAGIDRSAGALTDVPARSGRPRRTAAAC